MARLTVKQALKATKAELERVLADHRVRQYPSLYAGHEEDAIKFVRHCLGTTRRELLLSISVSGLVEADHGGIPHPGWHDEWRR